MGYTMQNNTHVPYTTLENGTYKILHNSAFLVQADSNNTPIALKREMRHDGQNDYPGNLTSDFLL